MVWLLSAKRIAVLQPESGFQVSETIPKSVTYQLYGDDEL